MGLVAPWLFVPPESDAHKALQRYVGRLIFAAGLTLLVLNMIGVIHLGESGRFEP